MEHCEQDTAAGPDNTRHADMGQRSQAERETKPIQDLLYFKTRLHTVRVPVQSFFLWSLLEFIFYSLSNQFLRKRVTSAVQILDLVHFLSDVLR